MGRKKKHNTNKQNMFLYLPESLGLFQGTRGPRPLGTLWGPGPITLGEPGPQGSLQIGPLCSLQGFPYGFLGLSV